MRNGFTLIEIMVVVAITAIVMAVGVPSMYRAMQKDPLARAVNDTVEGCKMARDRAILQGVPYEFVVEVKSVDEVVLNVAPAPVAKKETETTDGSVLAGKSDSSGAPYAAFPRRLHEDVEVQLVDVNFQDLMQAPEARARFKPNGTSDEFTIVYGYKGKQRAISLDVVTGLANELKRE